MGNSKSKKNRHEADAAVENAAYKPELSMADFQVLQTLGKSSTAKVGCDVPSVALLSPPVGAESLKGR